MTTSPSENLLVIAPWISGASTRDRVVVRLVDRPDYLFLSRAEFRELELLTKKPTSVSDWLGSHMTGQNGLGFREATTFLMKLHQAKFLLRTHEKFIAELRDFEKPPSSGLRRLFEKVVATAQTVLHIDVVSFRSGSASAITQSIGKALLSVPVLAFACVVAPLLAWFNLSHVASLGKDLQAMISEPEQLLAMIFVAFSIAATVTGLAQYIGLVGTGTRFPGGTVTLTGLCVLRFAVNDDDAIMLPKGLQTRYRILSLSTPWMCMLVSLSASSASSAWLGDGLSPATMLSLAFLSLGLLGFCPLYRSTIVKTAEGVLASGQILVATREFLHRGIIRNLFRREAGAEKRGAGDGQGDHKLQLWAVGLASAALIWLYAAFLFFTDIGLGLVPDLATHATKIERPWRAASATILLSGLFVAAAIPTWQMILILFRNMASTAALPVRRARMSMLSYAKSGVSTSEAIVQFLRHVPILGHLDDDQIRKLLGVMQLRSYGTGYRIIQQGEPGDLFCILAVGRAQVVIESGHGTEEVVDVLDPGDSFGEIALLEKSRRTATIRAIEATKTLVLSKRNFDALFVEGSTERQNLTRIIRQAKLISSSQGLSHLGPRQVRELLLHIKPRKFAMGEVLVAEGSTGDVVHLIESGTVQVTRSDAPMFRAELKKGDLVGVIAVVRETTRTATVTAVDDVSTLEIDRDTFVRMCRSNVIVATVMTELATAQIEEVKDERGRDTMEAAS